RAWGPPGVGSATQRGGCGAAGDGVGRRGGAQGGWWACPSLGAPSGALGGRRARAHPRHESPPQPVLALGRTADRVGGRAVGPLNEGHGPLDHERQASARLPGHVLSCSDSLLGPLEADDLTWYLERYAMWPSLPFQPRARAVEAVLPRWGQALYT